jgi:hypothetical protein
VRGHEPPQTKATYVVTRSRGLSPKCNSRNIHIHCRHKLLAPKCRINTPRELVKFLRLYNLRKYLSEKWNSVI